MEFNVQNLEYAVSVFYNSEQEEKTRAHEWLTTAQRCPEAWTFIWELLQSSKGTELQFFAATTLHTKLLRCWSEIPSEHYEELKEKILQAVIAFSKGPKIVLNRLCISLAAYVLQQGAENLVNILEPLSSTNNLAVLLEVLTVIPEEFNSMTMGSILRSRNRTNLQQACPAVLNDMLRHLQTVYSDEPPTEELLESWCKASACATSWLALGNNDVSPAGQNILSSNLEELMPLCLAFMKVVHVAYMCHEVVADTALEACEAALGAVRAAGSMPDSCYYPNAALQLLSSLTTLAHPLVIRDNFPNSQNEELVAAIVTCAVALGECHTRTLVEALQKDPPHEGAQNFLDLLLSCQGAAGHYPIHETRSQFSFGFWYTLQDEILCLLDSNQEMNVIWRTVFARLMNILIQKSETPQEDALTRDDALLMRCYRQDIADTVIYCHGIMGEWCWTAVETAWRETEGQGDIADLKREAALHVFLALADAAPPQRTSNALSQLMQHTIQTAASATNLRLLHTALECLGAYAMWLGSLDGAERNQGETLASAALLAAGSALPRMPRAGALALKKLSTECSSLAAPLASDIMQAAQSASGSCDAWVWRQLLGAAGAALAAAPQESAAPLLQELAQSIFNDMKQEGASSVTNRGGAEAAAALVTALSQRTDLAVDLIKCLLPALPPYAINPLLVPSLFHLLKHTVSVLMDDCLPLLDELSELMIKAIETFPCPVGVDVVKLTVLMFGSQWSGGSHLLRTCVQACIHACHTDPSSSSDVIEALFTALQTITKKKPLYVDVLEGLLPQILELGCNCVRLWEAGAARSACGWLSALARERPKLLRPHGPGLAASAVQCIGGATPRNQVEPLADLLLALNRAQWAEATNGRSSDPGSSDDLGHWLRNALSVPDFPTPHASQQQKQKFIAAVIKEKSSKRRLLETVQEFSLVCRGLIGTEYARQTLASKQLVA